MNEWKEKLKAALLAARAICDAADQAKREFTPEERQKLQGYLDEAAQLKAKIKAAEGDAEIARQVKEMGAGIEMASSGDGAQSKGLAGNGKSLGEQFVEAEAYKAWLKTVAPGGRLPEAARGLTSPAIEFGNLFKALGRKTLVTGVSDTSAGAFVQTDYTGIYEPLGRQELVLRNLIGQRTTGSDTVEFVRQTAKVTQAAPVQEANVATYSGATGEISGQKPEAAVAFEKVTATVKTIAVWIPATKRALSDASQLRGIIDQELRDDLDEEFEDQLINGNGVGENFTGLANTANTLSQAWDTDILTTTRKAITALKTTGRARPTAWLMNPVDWETIELLKDSMGRYYWGGPMVQGRRELWGYPVVESESQAQGTAWLGDWRKMIVWDRERATIQVSDSHSDFFIRNLIAILAEMRAAMGIIRPSAFCEVALESGS